MKKIYKTALGVVAILLLSACSLIQPYAFEAQYTDAQGNESWVKSRREYAQGFEFIRTADGGITFAPAEATNDNAALIKAMEIISQKIPVGN